MIMCLQSLVSFCQFVLKILSKNQILTSNKGHNSVANLRKTMIYNTNVDLFNDNVYTKFGLYRFIRFQDIEQKLNSDVNQGPCNSVANYPKFDLIQAFMHVLLTCKNEVDQIKNEGARVFTRVSHYKSMGIFPYAQGQLTPQSLIRSGRISNSFEMLWMSLLPASMKKIRLKIEALECSQHYTSIFQTGKGR